MASILHSKVGVDKANMLKFTFHTLFVRM